MKNPVMKYKTIENACKVVGFDVTLPKRYEPKSVLVISNKILELRFASVVVRKAKLGKEYNEELGISGVFTSGYPNNCNGMPFAANGVEGKQYWNGSAKKPKIHLCIYTLNDYAYSIYSENGITFKTTANWQANFR